MRFSHVVLPLVIASVMGGCSADERLAPLPVESPYPAALAAGYTAAVDLGTLPGGSWAEARAISDGGIVVGVSSSGTPEYTDSRATLWSSSGILNLGVLHGDSHSGASGINRWSVVIGYSCSPCRPFIWNPVSGMQALPTPASGHDFSAKAINDAGIVVGSMVTAAGSQHAIKWSAAGQVIDLHPAHALVSWASDINNAGRVVGVIGIEYQGEVSYTSAWWDAAGKLTVFGGVDTSPYGADAISDDGWIAGAYRAVPGIGAFTYSPAGLYQKVGASAHGLVDVTTHGRAVGDVWNEAAIYRNGAWATLAGLGGGISTAKAINSCGTIVGMSKNSAQVQRAALWDVRACR